MTPNTLDGWVVLRDATGFKWDFQYFNVNIGASYITIKNDFQIEIIETRYFSRREMNAIISWYNDNANYWDELAKEQEY